MDKIGRYPEGRGFNPAEEGTLRYNDASRPEQFVMTNCSGRESEEIEETPAKGGVETPPFRPTW